MSVFTKKLTQTDVTLFTGIEKWFIVLFLCIGGAHHVNFCQKNFIVYISKDVKLLRLLAHYLKKELLKTFLSLLQ